MPKKVTVDITVGKDGILHGSTMIGDDRVSASAKTEMILELRIKQALHYEHDIVRPVITMKRKKG